MESFNALTLRVVGRGAKLLEPEIACTHSADVTVRLSTYAGEGTWRAALADWIVFSAESTRLTVITGVLRGSHLLTAH